jgi:hypothetical protein
MVSSRTFISNYEVRPQCLVKSTDVISKDLVIIEVACGMTAAIYAQRALLDSVVLEQEAIVVRSF